MEIIEMEDNLKQFPDVYIDDKLPSFINVFLLELPKNIKFIYRSLEQQVSSPDYSHLKTLQTEDLNDSDFNVTGSPLNFTSYSLQVNDTVIKKCWSDWEEKYLPISLRNARVILSRYLTKTSRCNVPVWIVCDGLDSSKTVLLSSFKAEGWCTRSIVHYKGLLSLSDIKNLDDGPQLTSENVKVHCEFILCEDGASGNSLLNFTQNEFVAENCTQMSIKLQWPYASIEVPRDGGTAIAAMDLNIGSRASAINALWSQLNLILKYNENMMKIIYCEQFDPVPNNYSCEKELFDEISRKIISLLNYVENTVGLPSLIPRNNATNDKMKENILSVLAKQVICGTRPDIDIIDKIWLLLNELSDATSIAVCLNDVFCKLGDCNLKTLPIVKDNNTLLAKAIAACFKGDFITKISAGKAVELMVQSGIEKLKHDYLYIFRNLDVECSDCFKNLTLPIFKSVDLVKHNLKILAQFHVALDFICAAQFYFDFDLPDLKIFSQSVFKESCKVISSLDVLQHNPHVHMEVPLNFKTIVDHLPSSFSNLKMICSRDEKEHNYSVLLLRSQPIFPPSLMQFDNGNKEKEPDISLLEPQYYTYELSNYCDRIK